MSNKRARNKEHLPEQVKHPPRRAGVLATTLTLAAIVAASWTGINVYQQHTRRSQFRVHTDSAGTVDYVSVGDKVYRSDPIAETIGQIQDNFAKHKDALIQYLRSSPDITRAVSWTDDHEAGGYFTLSNNKLGLTLVPNRLTNYADEIRNGNFKHEAYMIENIIHALKVEESTTYDEFAVREIFEEYKIRISRTNKKPDLDVDFDMADSTTAKMNYLLNLPEQYGFAQVLKISDPGYIAAFHVHQNRVEKPIPPSQLDMENSPQIPQIVFAPFTSDSARHLEAYILLGGKITNQYQIK